LSYEDFGNFSYEIVGVALNRTVLEGR